MSELYVGIMSGTSLDGLDLALVRIENPFSMELLAFENVAFPEGQRAEYFDVIQSAYWEPAKILAMNHVLGENIAEAVHSFLRNQRVAPQRVTAIGLHGITFWHCPEGFEVHGGVGRGTLQLGDPFTVAAHTGIRVAFDFRQTDIALGGQGAPLVPFLDEKLFHDPELGRIVLNLGGIANLTFLPPGEAEIIAFDTGPANMVIDHLMQRHPTDPLPYDPDGDFAARGKVLEDLLEICLAHPFFSTTPPKSTGREDFGPSFCRHFLRTKNLACYEDLIATATMLTVVTIADAVRGYRHQQFGYTDFKELIVSGGGAHNLTLMKWLQEQLPELTVKTTDELGLNCDAKEAVLMAALAWALVHKQPGNFPSVSGASRRAVLGAITP
ncbi:anhydro-N-acetylmuramic acid kinase [Acanthopleuribacter pedis]|uniref:Anhydro-N-acetylmuramic acid kinase n=1 Tax=Acanthopleuribacter pedis TaxID=442870 RepID=A0A8J7Q340_9BACT|nr:anhydro-N-acetylmuramic acid kinase [Acanthopleuribacter pedis]MBO1318360.1 anhydro-N-acetylmuramic acid kinase [Acanthopleuribacter pedis]